MSRAQNRRLRYTAVGDRSRNAPQAFAVAEPAETVEVQGGLRYGFTLNDLHRITKTAMSADRSMAMDWRDRYDIAWSAVAEALYTADAAPTWQQLVQEGWQAIYADVRDTYRHHGYRDRAAAGQHGSAPRFAAYWWGRTVVGSHEAKIVERYALPAILGRLTDMQHRVVQAVAVFDGDRVRAAAHLGIGEKSLAYQLRTAREVCAALWLEGETPARQHLRRLDRRQHKGPEPEHGTSRAARRHRALRETPCDLCAPVLAGQEIAKKARRQLAGTVAGGARRTLQEASR